MPLLDPQDERGRMKHVYIPNRGVHDYSAAERFGELVFCTEGFVKRTDVGAMHDALADAMHDAEPDDFLILDSFTTLSCIAAGIFASRFGRLNLLLYAKGDYQPHYLTLD